MFMLYPNHFDIMTHGSNTQIIKINRSNSCFLIIGAIDDKGSVKLVLISEISDRIYLLSDKI